MRAKAVLSRLRPPTTQHRANHQPTQTYQQHQPSSSHPTRFKHSYSTYSHSPPPPAHSLSTQLKSIFITNQPQSDQHEQEQPSNHHSSTRLLSNQTTPSSIDLAYLNQLSESLNSDSYHQLSSPAFSQILNHLHSNDLFKHLSPGSFDLLLDFNPEAEENQSSSSIQSTHYYLYHRIIFLLDRIYEHKQLFTQADLLRFHSISLKRLAHVGLFRAAELIWDQLISPSATARQDDQILMLDCIRTACLNHQSSSQVHTVDHTTTHDNNQYHRELLPLSSKDFKRMISLTESIGKSLLTSTTNRIDRVTERWTVRTVAEILGIQGERTRLADWLSKQRSLDLDFPDNGASWSDPKLTAIVVRMFKDQGRLEKMIMIYEAALHPSASMLAHPGSSFGQIFEDTSEPATLKTLPDEKHFISNRRREQDENSRTGRKRNAILTRTYHDLISACTQANRPHLALHYLSEAVAENEAYVERLPGDHTVDPPVPHLRLQPATYAELIPSLVKKKRDTQLRKVHELSERLVRTTVAELQWIRLRAAAKADHLAGDPTKDSSPWGLVLAAIVPHLSGHPQTDLEASKSQNLALEKAVFTHANQPALDSAPRSRTPLLPELTVQPEHHIGFLRTLERATFLSKSLAHSIRLLHRLAHLIDKTRINRDLRFQHHLLKKKKNNNVLSSVHSSPSNLSRPGLTHHHHPPPSSSQSSAQSSANQIRTLERIDALIDKKHSLRFGTSSSPRSSN